MVKINLPLKPWRWKENRKLPNLLCRKLLNIWLRVSKTMDVMLWKYPNLRNERRTRWRIRPGIRGTEAGFSGEIRIIVVSPTFFIPDMQKTWLLLHLLKYWLVLGVYAIIISLSPMSRFPGKGKIFCLTITIAADDKFCNIFPNFQTK